ncbi:hypothetical protein VKT23_001503 [Stygiomarasmius scandens]|uniref:Uncharacterized protein n=1 Tax=Marasmiellus scandens TaxID=2682957 RepID=A0ABR1K1R4_9AGAR
MEDARAKRTSGLRAEDGYGDEDETEEKCGSGIAEREARRKGTTCNNMDRRLEDFTKDFDLETAGIHVLPITSAPMTLKFVLRPKTDGSCYWVSRKRAMLPAFFTQFSLDHLVVEFKAPFRGARNTG